MVKVGEVRQQLPSQRGLGLGYSLIRIEPHIRRATKGIALLGHRFGIITAGSSNALSISSAGDPYIRTVARLDRLAIPWVPS
jgi:hypothetical protein